MTNFIKLWRNLASFAIILSFVVVMLGAYTRLTDAGLGCPDWPGCYGNMVLPTQSVAYKHAQDNYPGIPIESRKAWTEMIHRYAAGTLAILIFSFAIRALYTRSKHWQLPLALAGLVIFQALLGMWTVTLKLYPAVVMGHLLGGMLIFAGLCYLRWQWSGAARDKAVERNTKWRFYVFVGMVLAFIQIALGGWVTANYAGVACAGSLRCGGEWLPHLSFGNSFHLLTPVGPNYQWGVLSQEARVTIQMVHRIGALIVASYLLMLSVCMLATSRLRVLRLAALILILIVVLQVVLGIINVIYILPLWTAVAHNGVAALLLAILVSLFYLVNKGTTHAS